MKKTVYTLFLSLSFSIVFGQQIFPTQMEGEYICDQRRGCSNGFDISLQRDATNSNRFQIYDSCTSFFGGTLLFQMSTTSNSFIGVNNGCSGWGDFYPQNDSLYLFRLSPGCGSGCTCGLIYKCKKILSTSVSEQSLVSVKLYPNPVQEQLRFKGLKQTTPYRLHNLQGQLLLNGQVQDGNAIELGKLAPGIYLLQLGEAEKSVWHKVVKE